MARRTNRMMQQGMPIQMHDKKAEMDAATSYIPRKSSRNGALVFGIATFALVFIVVVALWMLVFGRVSIYTLVAAALLALLAISSVHIALNWEKVVILRFGKLARVAGPGLYFTIPIIEHGTIRIDQRTMTTPFYAERTLTADLVPISVEAVLFAMRRRPVSRSRITSPLFHFLLRPLFARPSGVRPWLRWRFAVMSWISRSSMILSALRQTGASM